MTHDPGLTATTLLEHAVRTAAVAHHLQRRKGTDVPYFSHPAAVALLLARAGFDDDVILAAALLHDVLEDTELTEEDLRREFPEEVVVIVCAASERKLDDQGNKRPWIDRKREHIADIARAPLAARAVVLADKLHNLQSIAFDLAAGQSTWERFNAPRDQVLQYHEEMIEATASGSDELRSLASVARGLLGQLRGGPPGEGQA